MTDSPRTAKLQPQFFQALLILVGGFWVYSPALHGEWLWDDNKLVNHNPLMADPDGLWKIWFQPGVLLNYYPITYTVQRLQWALWGMDTFGYHLTNVALHITSAFLVWRLFGKLGMRYAWWGGLLFAVHPIMVESVAWIAELKNTLSLPPLLLAFCFWIDFDDRRQARDYWTAALLFLVAMLCKNAVTMMPVVILLHAWWKRGRIDGRDLKVSAPFFVMALALGVAGVWLVQVPAGPAVAAHVSGWERVDVAGRLVFFFLSLALFPVCLIPVYPSALSTSPSIIDLLPWFFAAAGVAAAWIHRRTWGRHVLLGFGFFAINLFPVLLFVLMKVTTMVWSMGHLIYLPIIGLIGLAVGGLEWLDRKMDRPVRVAVKALAIVLTALFVAGSYAYATLYGDAVELWTYAVRENPDAFMARANLGEALAIRGNIPAALNEFQEVAKMQPDYNPIHADLAHAYMEMGRPLDALREEETLLKLNPTNANAAYDVGNMLVRLGRLEEAAERYREALRLDPHHAGAHYAMGGIYLAANQLDDAVAELQQSLRKNPANAEAHRVLGQTFLRMKRAPDAIPEFAQAAQLEPNDAGTRCDLGLALLQAGHLANAAGQYQAALAIDPRNAGAHFCLGSIALATGELASAIVEFQAALRLRPDFIAARANLARAEELQKSAPSSSAK